MAQARESYAAARPLTQQLHERACAYLPGGNTRTVLYHRPFPLRIARAFDAILEDVDGHQYVDLLGEYSAGLYGHSHPIVTKAMADALAEGISRGAHTRYEIDLAEAICTRFASIERVRFTNSGTEANLLAITAARAFTGRDNILAFNGGYHGSLLTFKLDANHINAPYPVLTAEYNDTAGVRALFAENPGTIACVLVEPMQGSSGCIPGDPAFLAALRDGNKKGQVPADLRRGHDVPHRRRRPSGPAGHHARPDHAGQVHRRRGLVRRVRRPRRRDGTLRPDPSGSPAARGHLQQQRALDGGRTRRADQGLHPRGSPAALGQEATACAKTSQKGSPG